MSKLLRNTVELDGEHIRVAYEGLSTMCFTCGMVGHTNTTCPTRPPTTTGPPPPCASEEALLTAQQEVVVSNGGAGPSPSDTGYGPWTLVQASNALASKPGSRFTPLSFPNSEGDGMARQDKLTKHSNPIGKGLSTTLSSFLSTGKHMPSGPIFNSTGPRKNSKKGYKSQKFALAQREVGESSRRPPSLHSSTEQIVTLPLQPTTTDNHLAIVIPSHIAMVCDSQLLEDSEQVPPDSVHQMEGIADPAPQP
ncbi:hypothetical protein K2173_021985 [Erythroxylum novogranatense]|uniref:CCHC-type domain-containing protein n=1 Tax=Erythroxylum novogranatense TaxID=1862640 RepID=A0AAV8T2G6_9ROSI|nr:hypothetical protein K2173_021985 [Erythroxylum novogranatense]